MRGGGEFGRHTVGCTLLVHPQALRAWLLSKGALYSKYRAGGSGREGGIEAWQLNLGGLELPVGSQLRLEVGRRPRQALVVELRRSVLS